MKVFTILSSISLLVLLNSQGLKAQFTVSYHQSFVHFAGFNYETPKGWIPELRIGTNMDFNSFSFETLIHHTLIKKPDYTFYGGAGLSIFDAEFLGIFIPAGLNIYPFQKKEFGFQMEIGPSFWGDGLILRGSVGIRYRFIKDI